MGKAKLDEMLQARRPAGLKTSLGYVTNKHTLGHTLRILLRGQTSTLLGQQAVLKEYFKKETLLILRKEDYTTSANQENHPLCAGIVG